MKKKLSIYMIILFVFVFAINTLYATDKNVINLVSPVTPENTNQINDDDLEKIAPLQEEQQEEDMSGGDDYVISPTEALEEEAQAQEQIFIVGARNVYNMMPAVHFLHKPMNLELGAVAWTNYIDILDLQHIYFTQEDIDEFEEFKDQQISLLKTGDFSYAIHVLDVFRTRIKEYEEFSVSFFEGKSPEEFLAMVDNFSTNEEFLWKRKNAPWAATKEEQHKIWADRLKNQYIVALINEALKREKAAAEQSENSGAHQNITVADIVTPEFHEETIENILKSVRRFNEVMADSDVDTYKTYFINSFTEAYDPHSSYFSPEKKEDFDIGMGLSLQGIGATLSIEDGMPKVVDIIPGSPADRDMSENHLIPGDKIIAVAQGDGEFVDVTHWPLNKAVRLIRGPKDTVVRLKVIPSTDPTGTTTKIVTLVRDEIKLEEQAVSYIVKEVTDSDGNTRKVGYINLPSFYSNAATIEEENYSDLRSATIDMEKAISDLKTQGVEGIVLDLRGNGGGSLSEAISITGLFIKRGPVVLVKERYRVHTLRDDNSSVAYTGPLVVLIDKLSASASEIVAGALQDYGRAIIIGDEQTHGKGTVQTVMPLGYDGEQSLGALKATTASFYRINGSSTQIKGVASDIVLSSVFDCISEFGEDQLPNAIPHSKVKRAPFTKIASLEETIEYVSNLSAERLATNENWAKHLVMLDNLNASNTNLYASLNFQVRLDEERATRAATKDTIDEDSDEALYISSSSSSGEQEDADEAVRRALEEAAKTPEQREQEREEQKQRMRDRDVVLNESYFILIDIIDSNLPTGELESKQTTDMDFILNFFSPEGD